MAPLVGIYDCYHRGKLIRVHHIMLDPARHLASQMYAAVMQQRFMFSDSEHRPSWMQALAVQMLLTL